MADVSRFCINWGKSMRIFTEQRDSSALEEVFKTVPELCASDNAVVKMTIQAHSILFYRLIDREPESVTDKLTDLCCDIAELIRLCNQVVM